MKVILSDPQGFNGMRLLALLILFVVLFFYNIVSNLTGSFWITLGVVVVNVGAVIIGYELLYALIRFIARKVRRKDVST